MDSKTLIKQRLRNLRDEKRLIRQQVSKDTGIPVATIESWEYGKTIPTLTTIEPLAQYYGVSIDYIAGRTDEPSINKPSEPKNKEQLD